MNDNTKTLSQFFTPLWLAEMIVERYFGNLDSNDVVLEPSCGQGAFLRAIPNDVFAYGVEIDPKLVPIAEINSGRLVVQGDFRSANLPYLPTVIIGNPPFNMSVFDGFLERAHGLLEDGGKMGMLLPAYAFQTASRVAGYSENWSMAVDQIPRNVFEGISMPLVFSTFIKDKRRVMVGLAFFLETHGYLALAKPYREALKGANGPIWKTVCKIALSRLGGKADLQDIYREVEGNRPTGTKFWREKVRQTLRVHGDMFKAIGGGHYALSERVPSFA